MSFISSPAPPIVESIRQLVEAVDRNSKTSDALNRRIHAATQMGLFFTIVIAWLTFLLVLIEILGRSLDAQDMEFTLGWRLAAVAASTVLLGFGLLIFWLLNREP